jgi:hypothetical protein
MDILCSDKTGTLTLNKLTVDHVNCYPLSDHSIEEVRPSCWLLLLALGTGWRRTEWRSQPASTAGAPANVAKCPWTAATTLDWPACRPAARRCSCCLPSALPSVPPSYRTVPRRCSSMAP